MTFGLQAIWTTPNWTTYDVWTTAVWTTPQIDYTVIGTTSVWTTKFLIKKFVLKQSLSPSPPPYYGIAGQRTYPRNNHKLR